MMRAALLTFLSLSLAAFCATAAFAQQPWIVGSALSVDGEKPLYQELHYRASQDRAVSDRVEYLDQNEKVIVTKTLQYNDALATPVMEQIDYRNDTRIFTRDTGSGFEIGYKRQGEALRLNEIERSERLVIDAGFDSYVRTHWDALLAGDTIRGEFLVPARLDTVNIGIRKVDQDDCEPRIQDVLCLTVRPAGFLRLVSWLVDPLTLAYDEDTKRLVQYKGISNLLDDDGNTQDVIITYQY